MHARARARAQVKPRTIATEIADHPESPTAKFLAQYVQVSNALVLQCGAAPTSAARTLVSRGGRSRRGNRGGGGGRGGRGDGGAQSELSKLLSQMFQQLRQSLAEEDVGSGGDFDRYDRGSNGNGGGGGRSNVYVALHADVASAIWRCVHVLCGTLKRRARTNAMLVEKSQARTDAIGGGRGSRGASMARMASGDLLQCVSVW